MTISTGYEAVFKVGTDIVGQVSSFTINKTLETVDVSTIGVVSKQFVSTLEGWSGSANMFFDPTDTASIAILDACVGGGPQITCNFYINGTVAADKYYYGFAYVTAFDQDTTAAGVAEASISFTGTGPLTQGTQV
jgi:hypothetical protein